MTLVTRSRFYGVLAGAALLACFIVPPALALSGTSCSLWSLQPGRCEAGVRPIFGVAISYCLIAGFLVNRALARQPELSRLEAMLMLLGTTLPFAMPLWLMLRAAFW